MGNREKKQLMVSETIAKFKDSTGVIITDYQGLSVEQINELRRELEKVGAGYKVVKNTLSKRALDELKINSGFKKLFTGVTGMVFCEDYVAAIKALAKFGKENEQLEIKGGYIEEKQYSIEQIKEISKLASREELIAKLAMALNSPISGIVNVLAGPGRGLVNALKAVADKK